MTSCCARYACAPEVSLYSQRGSAISRLHMNGTSGVFNRRPLGGNVSVRSFQQAATGEFVNDRVHEHQHWDDIPNSAEMGRLELITAKSLEHPNTRRCTNRYYLLTTVFPSCRPGVACVLSSTFSLIPVTYHSCKLSVQCLMWSSWSTCFCFGQDGVLARLQDVSFWPVPAALPEKRGGIRDIIEKIWNKEITRTAFALVVQGQHGNVELAALVKDKGRLHALPGSTDRGVLQILQGLPKRTSSVGSDAHYAVFRTPLILGPRLRRALS